MDAVYGWVGSSQAAPLPPRLAVLLYHELVVCLLDSDGQFHHEVGHLETLLAFVRRVLNLPQRVHELGFVFSASVMPD